jgi:hypothetical protein
MPGALFGVFAVAILIWVYAHVRLHPDWIGFGSLLLVTAVRLFGVELGERDIAQLRTAHAKAGGGVGYALSGEDIWHEFGQMSVALGERVELLRTSEEREGFLRRGGLLILSDEQGPLSAGLRCEGWMRMKRRLQMPLQDLFLKGLSFHDPALRRGFHLCRGPAS